MLQQKTPLKNSANALIHRSFRFATFTLPVSECLHFASTRTVRSYHAPRANETRRAICPLPSPILHCDRGRESPLHGAPQKTYRKPRRNAAIGKS
jgi:hypothetical protein